MTRLVLSLDDAFRSMEARCQARRAVAGGATVEIDSAASDERD